MCMNSLRRASLGLMARNPKMPSARPNHVGISAVGCALPVPKITNQTQEQSEEPQRPMSLLPCETSVSAHGKNTSCLDEPHRPTMHNSESAWNRFNAGCAPSRDWRTAHRLRDR